MRKILLVLLLLLVLSAALVVPAAAQGTTTYVVQPGDTLASIARQFCTTWQQIYHMNKAVIGPNPNVLRPGTVLVVPNNCGGGNPPPTPPPGGGTVPCDTGPTAHAKGPINGNVYTVTFGDTMFSISRRFCTTVSQLSAANGISNPWLIFVGQRLTISGGQPPPNPTPSPTPPSPTRYVTISTPTAGQVVPLVFTATGTGAGLFEGNVVVSAFTNGGQLLAQVPTTLQGPNVGTGGPGTWQATLTVNVAPGTAGYIQATSPQSNVAPAQVSVTYGSGQTTPFLDIQAPANNATVPSPFTVSGIGAGLFNSTIVVQAFNSANQFLGQQTTTLQGSQVGSGGQGTWSVSMSVNVTAGTTGHIHAFSSQYGVQDQVNVTYGSGQPAQCSIVSIPSAPYYQFPGGALMGNFSPAGGTFPASDRAWNGNQYWYRFTLDPNNPSVQYWAPTSSISALSGTCPW